MTSTAIATVRYFKQRGALGGLTPCDGEAAASVVNIKSADGITPAFAYAFRLPAEKASFDALMLGLHLGNAAGRHALAADVRKIFGCAS